jgi:hypothetical protein
MAYCTKCGTKSDDDATFCKKCGASIKAPAEAHVPVSGPEPQHPPASLQHPGGPPPPVAPGPHPKQPKRYDHQRDWDDRCEEECAGSHGRYSWIWGALIILIGMWIVFELGIKNIDGVPDWVKDFDIGWILPVLFGILIILVGLDAIQRTARYR